MEELGGYRIVDELGRGGMGVVYRAVDPNGNTVALKSLNLGTGRRSERARIRMQREAEALARLEHPGLVPCYACGEAPSGLFFVMGLVEGRSVGELLREGGPLPVPQALRIMGDVAETLAYVHGQGYLHRDLKPDNVMISDSGGRTVLADFGMVKLLDVAQEDDAERLTRTGAFMGTPGFCSPEQAFGKETVTPASDVYGWAATLYCLLSGQPPRDVTSMHVFLASLRKPVTPVTKHRPEVPAWLDALLCACLSREPANRPSLEQVRRALHHAGGPPGASTRLKLTALGLTVLAIASLVLVAVLAAEKGATPKAASLSALDSADATPGDSAQPSAAVAEPEGPGPRVFRLLQAGRMAEAADMALAWHAAEPDSLSARLACADTLLRTGRAGLALPHAEALLEHKDLAAGAVALSGRVLLLNQKLEGARACLARARELDPSDIDTNLLAAQLAFVDDDFAAAVAAFSRVIERSPTAYVLSRRAWAYVQLEEHERALADAERALRLDPSSRHAREVQARVISRWVDPARGERLLRALLADFPDNATAAIDLERLLEAQGRRSERLQLLQRPELKHVPGIQFKLGEEYYRQGKPAEADEAFARVLQVPTVLRAEAYFFRGCLRQDAGRHQDALAEFSRALEATPSHLLRPLIHDYRARSYNALGQVDAALRELERCLGLDPTNRKALIARVQVLFVAGRLEPAAGAAQAFLEAQGAAPGRDGALAYLALGAYAGSKGDSAAALQNYARALELNETPAAHYMRGGQLLGLERREEAAAAFRRAVALEPSMQPAWAGLMRACAALGQREEAQRAARRYLDLGGGKDEARARELLDE